MCSLFAWYIMMIFWEIYFGIGILASVYILFMFLRGVYQYMRDLYIKEYVCESNITIQFGYHMGCLANSWWGVLLVNFMFTFSQVLLALTVWPFFIIWVINYTIKVARKKKFGRSGY